MTHEACSVPEEAIVDLALGRHASRTAERLLAHARGCARCRRLLQEWSQSTLAPRVSEVRAPQRLRRRIMQRAAARLALARLRRGVTRRKVAVACAGLVLALATVGLLRYQAAPEPIPVAGFEAPDRGPKLLWQPGAAKYTVFAGTVGAPISGEVWLDNRSGEMLLILSGVGPEYELDYQAWSMKEDLLRSIGLLKMTDRAGYLYVRDPLMGEPDHIIVSAEPKGGSRFPTGPEKIRIVLRQ